MTASIEDARLAPEHDTPGDDELPPTADAVVRAPDVPETRAGRWWVLSVLCSAILLVILTILWVIRDQRDPTTDQQLVDKQAVDVFLDQNARKRGSEDAIHLATGVFIQSLQFQGPNDVHLTGYVWHRFPGDVRDAVGTGSIQEEVPVVDPSGTVVAVHPGFIFPEQVDSSFEIDLRSVIYNPPREIGLVQPAPDPRAPTGAATTTTPPPPTTPPPTTTGPPPSTAPPTTPPTTAPHGETPEPTIPPMLLRSAPGVGDDPAGGSAPSQADDPRAAGSTTALYYFEAPVRQPFQYADYPFDHKVVWLRIWPAEFEENVVLVPDFDAYPCREQPTRNCTGGNDVFGVDNAIELGDFTRENTYFDYHLEEYYNSNLGNSNFQQSDYPELRFNVLVRRNLLNAFVANLVPLLVAAGLAFGILMTMTTNDRRSRRFGFSTTQVMTTLAALFFAVLIAHQVLRAQFEGVVYLESFYFLMYLVLLGVGVIAILISAPATRRMPVFAFGDNLLAQVLYWPTILASAVLITLIAL